MTSDALLRGKSWKKSTTIPRFLITAVYKGMDLADSIGIEEANDKTWLTIKFTKFPKKAKR